MNKNSNNFTAEEIFIINQVWHKYEAKVYNKSHDEIIEDEKKLWKKLSNKYIDSDTKNILDFGCGTGFVSQNIEEFLPKESILFYADPSDSMLETAKKNINKNNKIPVKIVNENFKFDRDFNDGIDLVVINSVLHHIPNLEELFEKLHDLLRKKGKVIIAHEPNSEFYNSLYQAFYLFFEKLSYARDSIFSKKQRVTSNKSKIDIVERVNNDLIDKGIVKKPLDRYELQSLVDYHSPSAKQKVDKSKGFNQPFFEQSGDFKVIEFKTYNPLKRIKGFNTAKNILSSLFPKNGAMIYTVLQKS